MSQEKLLNVVEIAEMFCSHDPEDPPCPECIRKGFIVRRSLLPELTLLTDEEILTAMQTAHPEGEEYPRWRKLEGRLLREVRNVAQTQLSKNKKELGQ